MKKNHSKESNNFSKGDRLIQTSPPHILISYLELLPTHSRLRKEDFLLGQSPRDYCARKDITILLSFISYSLLFLIAPSKLVNISLQGASYMTWNVLVFSKVKMLKYRRRHFIPVHYLSSYQKVKPAWKVDIYNLLPIFPVITLMLYYRSPAAGLNSLKSQTALTEWLQNTSRSKQFIWSGREEAIYPYSVQLLYSTWNTFCFERLIELLSLAAAKGPSKVARHPPDTYIHCRQCMIRSCIIGNFSNLLSLHESKRYTVLFQSKAKLCGGNNVNEDVNCLLKM